MKHVIAHLENYLQMLTNNEPIHRAEGNIPQADLELAAAAETRLAIELLKEVVIAKFGANEPCTLPVSLAIETPPLRYTAMTLEDLRRAAPTAVIGTPHQPGHGTSSL